MSIFNKTFCPLTALLVSGEGSELYSKAPFDLKYAFYPIGRVYISDDAQIELLSSDKATKAKLAGICRNAFENNEECIKITSAYIADLDNVETPSNKREKSNNLINYMHGRGGKDYEAFSFKSDEDYPLAYALDAEEFNKIMKHLFTQGFIIIENEIGMAGHLVLYQEVTLTDKGIDQAESRRSIASSTANFTQSNNQMEDTPRSTMDIFISHSSHDAPIARTLIELIRSALNVSPERIRCTSVEGYKLPSGSATDDQIKKEVLDAKVLLGIISPASVESTYVIFELGARWGIGKPLIPLTTSNIGVELLKGPLKGINAMNSTVRTDVLQLITDLGKYLDITPQQPSVYDNKVSELVKLSLAEILPTKGEAALNKELAGGKAGNDYLNADEIIKQQCLIDWPDDFSMRLHCVKEQTKALDELKTSQPKDIPDNTFLQIRRKAAIDWPSNFMMRLHAEAEQIKAYRLLNK